MRFPSIIVRAFVLLPLSALAQSPKPSDPTVEKTASPMRYESAFADYMACQNPSVGNWRQHNDQVRQAGSHAGDVKVLSTSNEASTGDGASTPPAVPEHNH